MRSSAAIALALTALLVLSTAGMAGAVPTGSSASDDGAAPPHVLDSQTAPTSDAYAPLEPAEPQQTIRISVTENGDAVWSIESQFVLEDDDDVEAFEAYAESVTEDEFGDSYEGFDFQSVVESAEASTDRDMAMEDEGWDEPDAVTPSTAGVDPDDVEDGAEIGVISYSFTWTNFASVENDGIVFGDAFATEDGQWFQSLNADQRLLVEPPSNYVIEDAPVATPGGTATWTGHHTFEDDELEMVMVESVVQSFLGPVMSAVAGGLVVAIVFGGLYLATTRTSVRKYVQAVLRRSPSAEDDTPAEARADSVHDPADRPVPADVDPSATPTESVPTVTEDDVDPHLLSDDERVLGLLRGNGGRMRQATIVDETDWSNAKVSQLLSKMDENDEIEKLRIGRENLITLPEVDPTEVE